ncbi:phage tail assembly chaperone G [Streptococcus danieliae]|uniref:phage tail assembly chaperone G n=1 Tax=Streptococcus danieliae TaxID=747656 RepID=UPI0021C61C2F|nr:hypothetical protein [Streptococcus danieliae]MCU0082166.1 hypothetical protein [Streptococcus danieliae]
MSKLKITIKNKYGEEEVRRSKEITARDYRDFLVLRKKTESEEVDAVEVFDLELEFIVGLFEDVTVDELLDYTDYRQIYEIYLKVYEHLVGGGSDDEEGKK